MARFPFVWEEIERNDNHATSRVPVEGGWIVNHVVYPQATVAAPAKISSIVNHVVYPQAVETFMIMNTVFIPDDQHRWSVSNIEPEVLPDLAEPEKVEPRVFDKYDPTRKI